MPVLLICKYKKDFWIKMAEKTCSYNIFRPSKQAYSVVSGEIRSKFKLLTSKLFCMFLLHCTYKNEDQIKNEGARVAITLHPWHSVYSRHSRAAYATILSNSSAKFKLIKAFLVVLITCKNEEDPIKNESARVVTTLNIDFQTLKDS